MEFIPVKTRILQPPQDDLLAVLDESLPELQEKDAVLITSKVVAIHEGRCVPIEGTDKEALVEQEADYLIDRSYYKFPLSIKYNTFIASGGIDESNSAGYYTLLPEDAFLSAKTIWEYLREKHQLQELGVIITDSHLSPLRFGCLGVSIAFWGIEPVEFHQGKPDLFGREIHVSSSNMIDALAAGAALVMGEVAECQPVVIARDVPDLRFTELDRRHSFLIEPQNDMFRVLFENHLSKDIQKETEAFLGLGANLDSKFGTPPETLEKTIDAIKERGIKVLAVSPLYKTAPVPLNDDPWYHNQVICIKTKLSAHDLLRELNQIEAEFGRVRTEKNAPRVLDLDILTFGEYLLHDNDLSVPHPRMTERAFVLYPLKDLEPDWRHPMTGKHIDEFITDLPEQAIEKIDE